MILKINLIKKLKPFLFLLLLTPCIFWIYKLINNQIGVNPIDSFIRKLGEFSLQLLIVTLLITPLSRIIFLKNIIHLRRTIGLFAFFYICLHFISYIFLDHFFNWEYILKDIYKRPFITFGFVAFLLSIPLAITSNNISVRKLSFKIWKKIHKLIYIITPLAGLHYFLLTKADKREPIIYLFIIFILISLRIFNYFSKKESWPK